MSDAPTVEAWIERALYDPDEGFYETGGRAGRRSGSFLTSPEVGPLFGAVVANAIDRWWEEAGRPDEWHLVDAGAGPGTLCRTVLAAQPACAEVLRITAVERSAAQRALHPDTVTSTADLPDRADVVVANELLDNLPFGLVEHTATGWVPVRVVGSSTQPDTGGRRVPVAAAAAAWVTRARRIARHVVALDYADTTAALAAQPWPRWVRAFRDHELVADPFAEPGSRDVTVVVPHDQLPSPTASTTQAEWLRRHGLDGLVAEGWAYWQANAAAPDVRALTMRSRTNEATALTDPSGLGGFWVGEWHR